MKVLMVDADPHGHAAIANVLTKRGCVLFEADDCEEATFQIFLPAKVPASSPTVKRGQSVETVEAFNQLSARLRMKKFKGSQG
jgi:hypothetical protein